MASRKNSPDIAQNPKNSDKKIDQFMKDNNYAWDDELKTFKQPKNSNAPDIPESSMNYKVYVPLLKMLFDNKLKLEALLTCQKANDYQYQVKGKRGTKTIFISVSLANLINAYSKENSVSMSILFETAIIHFLINNGYEDKVKEILAEDSSKS